MVEGLYESTSRTTILIKSDMKFLKGRKQNMELPFEADKEWVDQNLFLLLDCFGFPQTPFVELNAEYFPKSHGIGFRKPQDVLQDLLEILKLDTIDLELILVPDFKDLNYTPIATEGPKTHAHITVEGPSAYNLHIENNLSDEPQWMLKVLITEVTRLYLLEIGILESVDEQDDAFVELASCFLGFGPILSHTLTYSARNSDGLREWKVNYQSILPVPVMTYSLACIQVLSGQPKQKWLDHCGRDIASNLSQLMDEVASSNEGINSQFTEQNFLALKQAELAVDFLEQKEFDQACKYFELASKQATLKSLKDGLVHDYGYYSLRLGRYNEAITQLLTVVEGEHIDPYALDNLGCAYILNGQMLIGLNYLEKAANTEGNLVGYTLRNFGLYNWKMGDLDKALDYLHQAENQEEEVDGLNYYLGCVYETKGESVEAKRYFKIADEMQDPELSIPRN